MSSLGSTPSFTTYRFCDVGSNCSQAPNQASSNAYTMPQAGWVVGVVFYADGDTGSATLIGCVWDSGDNLLGHGAGVSCPGGSKAKNGQAWHTDACGFFLPSGKVIHIGWTKASGATMVWSEDATNFGARWGFGGDPGNFSTCGSVGLLGAYINYNPISNPSAVSAAASNVQSTTATVNGTVGDGGQNGSGDPNSSHYYFQYGTDPGLAGATNTAQTAFNGTGQAASFNLTGLTINTTYYFRVVAVNDAGQTIASNILSFATLGLPNPPTLTAPANNAAQNAQTSSVTFAWTYNTGGAGGGETNYALKLTASGVNYWWNGTSLQLTEIYVVEATTKTIPAGILGPNVTYLWTVSSQDANGKGAYASPFTFISEGKPSAPTLISPANGSYVDMAGTTPTLTWQYNPGNAVGGQTNFAIRRKISGGSTYSYFNVGTNSWQGTIVWNAGSAQSYTFTAGLWVDGNTYNWSIATQDAGGQGNFAPDYTLTAQAVPVVTVTAPTGPIAQSKPVVVWSTAYPSGAVEVSYQVRTFSAAQYGAGGFNPATSAAVDDSGVVSSTSVVQYQVQTVLPVGTSYRSYVQVIETGNEGSGFVAFAAFTVTLDLPPAPFLQAVATTDPVTSCPMIQLTVNVALNILSSVDGSFESGIGTFVGTNCTLAQSGAQALDGSFSLAMTATTGAANMSAASGFYAVQPSTLYTMLGNFRANTTGRNVQVVVNWYDATHTLISTSTGSTVADSNSSWAQASVSAISPANAAYAIAIVVVTAQANGEVHYVDEVGIFPAQIGINFVGNPSFDLQANSTANGWLVATVGTGTATTADQSFPHGGAFNAKLTNPSAGNYGVIFSGAGNAAETGPTSGQVFGIAIPSGATAVVISAWIKGSVGGGTFGPLRVTFSNASQYSNQPSSNGGTTTRDNSITIPDNLYHQYLFTVLIPGGFTYCYIEILANGNGTTPTTYVDDVAIQFASATTVWTAGGFLATAGIVITRSDGLYVRGASTTNPAPAPAGEAPVVVNDYEVTPQTPYTYQALIQATGAQGLVQSNGSNVPGASLATTGWWELDPTNPSTAVNANPIQFNPSNTEQSAAHQVLGQQTMQVIASAMMKTDMTATMELFDPATYAAFYALLTSQKTVFFSDPFGFSYYFRIAPGPGGMSSGAGNKAHDTQLMPSTASGPHRTVAITGIAQPRPAV